jgi:hypothetical protein
VAFINYSLLSGNSLRSNLSAVRVRGLVASGANDLVFVTAVVVTGVDGIFGAPALGVESAVGTERNAVLGEDVRSEEVAGLVLAVGVDQVVLVKLGLRVAGGSAKRRVVRVLVEETHTVVGVVVLAFPLDQGSVDGSGEVGRSFEVGDRRCTLADGSIALGVACVDISLGHIGADEVTYRCYR